MRRISIGLVMLAAIVMVAPARAQNSPVEQIKRHHFIAMENYDLGDFKAARDELTAAIEKARAAKLDKDILTARTHVMLGSIYINGLGDEAKAVEEFKSALAIAPGIKLEAPHDSEAARAAFAKADAQLVPVSPCAELQGIEHKSVARAVTGVPIELSAQAEDVLLSGKASVSFQIDDGDYQEIPMRRTGKCGYAAKIPGEAVRGEVMRYYLTVRNKEGRVFAMRGNPRSPFAVSVAPPAAPDDPVEIENSDETPEALRLGKTKKGGGCAGCVAGADHGAGTGLLVVVAGMLSLRRRRRG